MDLFWTKAVKAGTEIWAQLKVSLQIANIYKSSPRAII